MLYCPKLHVFLLAACFTWKICVFLSWVFLFYLISVKLQEITESVCIVVPMTSEKFVGKVYRLQLQD